RPHDGGHRDARGGGMSGALPDEHAERHGQGFGESLQGLSRAGLAATFNFREEGSGNAGPSREFGLSETPVFTEHAHRVVSPIYRPPDVERKSYIIPTRDRRIALSDDLPNPFIFLCFVLTGATQQIFIVGQGDDDELLASVSSNDLRFAHRSLPLTIYFAS